MVAVLTATPVSSLLYPTVSVCTHCFIGSVVGLLITNGGLHAKGAGGKQKR